MNRDDIIRMAMEAWLDVYGLGKDRTKFAEALERFAELVTAQERDACAKVCEERSKGWDNPRPARDEAEAMMRYAAKHEARALGEAIRARSET